VLVAERSASRSTGAGAWGDLRPVVSVKELMRDMLDPASDYVFDAVGINASPLKGTIEKAPQTDAEWERIRVGGVTLAEGAYLLKIPRPFAPAGDEKQQHRPRTRRNCHPRRSRPSSRRDLGALERQDSKRSAMPASK
jgi:hypothetical protein